VTQVKDQGQCGSCYSFSVTGAIEGQLFRSSGKLISLSEQQIMDCTGRGCDGGWMGKSFEYVHQAGGIETEDDYYYQGPNGGTCDFEKSKAVATVGGYDEIGHDENSLQEAVANIGPISFGMSIEDSFMSYGGGVYTVDNCYSEGGHAMLIVGYGSDPSFGDYWLVKNSWVSMTFHELETFA
jgi:cathepsin L